MRHYFFLHYGWFFQNIGKEAVRTFTHTTVYQNLQELLLLAAKKEDYSEVLDKILEFDEDDFDLLFKTILYRTILHMFEPLP